MRVTDLMVGDWVSVSGKSVKITKDDLATMLIFLDDDSKINPIPLTEEILVKNGFKHSMPHNDWTNADCNFFLYEGGNGFRVQNTDIKLDYVHQFQHALRLCGIEKEIEL